MDFWHWPSKEHREYLERRKMWDQSLSQDTYTVEEAAKYMKLSQNTVRRLIREGKLYATNRGERNTVIPKKAIVDFMVPPRHWLDFYQ